jgi:protein-disulfide isomerase
VTLQRSKTLARLALILATIPATLVVAGTSRPEVKPRVSSATSERVLKYIRERFGITDSVKISIDPWQEYSYPEFFVTTVTVESGKDKRTQNVYLTKDRRFLVVGNLFPLGSDPKPEIVRRVREAFKVPAAAGVTVAPFQPSSLPNLQQVSVTVENGNQKQAQDFYVTRDNRCLILGSIYNLAVDPRLEALHMLSLHNQPSQGPASAPVTIVEFSDLQCPSCARLHEFLEKEVVPKYGSKVRLVFKDFPLVTIHDWTLTGTIASQCVYEINPKAFVPFRSLVFQNQGSINAANVRDMVLSFGEQVGVKRVQLAGCLDAKSSLSRIEANILEGRKLGVQSTPTCYINGKIIVGLPPPEDFYKVVDKFLRAAQ